MYSQSMMTNYATTISSKSNAPSYFNSDSHWIDGSFYKVTIATIFFWWYANDHPYLKRSNFIDMNKKRKHEMTRMAKLIAIMKLFGKENESITVAPATLPTKEFVTEMDTWRQKVKDLGYALQNRIQLFIKSIYPKTKATMNYAILKKLQTISASVYLKGRACGDLTDQIMPKTSEYYYCARLDVLEGKEILLFGRKPRGKKDDEVVDDDDDDDANNDVDANGKNNGGKDENHNNTSNSEKSANLSEEYDLVQYEGRNHIVLYYHEDCDMPSTPWGNNSCSFDAVLDAHKVFFESILKYPQSLRHCLALHDTDYVFGRFFGFETIVGGNLPFSNLALKKEMLIQCLHNRMIMDGQFKPTKLAWDDMKRIESYNENIRAVYGSL
jgi:hypothetical protein